MGLPSDVVLDGYTLIEQHEIDHEFLLRGSPLSTNTPLLFALISPRARAGHRRCAGRGARSKQAVVDALRLGAALR